MNLEQVQTEVKISLVLDEVKSWMKFRKWRRWICFLMFAILAVLLALWVLDYFDLFGSEREWVLPMLAYSVLLVSLLSLSSFLNYRDSLRKELTYLIGEEEAEDREYELSLVRFADEKVVREYFYTLRAITDDIVRAKRVDNGCSAEYRRQGKGRLKRLKTLATEICQGNGNTYLYGFSVYHNRKLRRYESYFGVKPC